MSEDLTGWYVTFTVGAACLLALITVVAVILDLARRISASARDVSLVLGDCRANTAAIPDIADVVVLANGVTGHLVKLRLWLGSSEGRAANEP